MVEEKIVVEVLTPLGGNCWSSALPVDPPPSDPSIGVEEVGVLETPPKGVLDPSPPGEDVVTTGSLVNTPPTPPSTPPRPIVDEGVLVAVSNGNEELETTKPPTPSVEVELGDDVEKFSVVDGVVVDESEVVGNGATSGTEEDGVPPPKLVLVVEVATPFG